MAAMRTNCVSGAGEVFGVLQRKQFFAIAASQRDVHGASFGVKNLAPPTRFGGFFHAQKGYPVIEKASAAVAYTGGGTALAFGLTSGQWQALGVVGGLLVGVAGLIVNAYFKNKHLQLAKKNYEGRKVHDPAGDEIV